MKPYTRLGKEITLQLVKEKKKSLSIQIDPSISVYSLIYY